MKKLFFLQILLCLLLSSAHAVPKISQNSKHNPKSDIPIDQTLKRKMRFGLDIGSRTNFNDSFIYSAVLGYQKEYLGFDIKASYASGAFETFFVRPTQAEKDSATNAGSLGNVNSEINRQRKGTDVWSYFLVQPGASVTGRIIPYKLKQFSQTARVGMGRVMMRDTVYRHSFVGWIMTWDAHFNYQLSMTSPYSVVFGATYNWGWINSTDGEQVMKSSGRIPLAYFLVHLGFNYAFW